PPPEQPGDTQPYALLVFPDSIRLIALDTQTIDSRVRIQELRVAPGRHRLRLAYTGPSPRHAGQVDDPVCLATQAGHRYFLGTKALGIIWRPVVDTDTLIPGHCTAHACAEAPTYLPPQTPLVAFCQETQ